MSTITELLAAVPAEPLLGQPDGYVRIEDWQRAKIARRDALLRVAYEMLKYYGCHVHNGSHKLCASSIHSKNPCDCGLEQALAAINPLAAGTAREAV